MTYSLGPKSRLHLVGVHPDLMLIIETAIKITTQDFGVTGKAVRTAEEQHKLFLRGVTQKDGYRHKSNHQVWSDGYGHAVDLTAYVPGKGFDPDSWELYYPIAAAMSRSANGLGLGSRLTWGGNWFETMDRYGSTPDDMRAARARYEKVHPGPDFVDGPHFQIS